jgi:hypothetical protein
MISTAFLNTTWSSEKNEIQFIFILKIDSSVVVRPDLKSDVIENLSYQVNPYKS